MKVLLEVTKGEETLKYDVLDIGYAMASAAYELAQGNAVILVEWTSSDLNIEGYKFDLREKRSIQ